MVSLEEKLKQIYQKIDDEEETISLKEVHELFSQAKKECDKEEGRATKDNKEQMVLIIMKFFNFNARVAFKWKKNEISLTDEDLNLIDEGTNDKSLQLLDEVHKEFPLMIDDKTYSSMRGTMKRINPAIQKEKTHRQNNNNDNTNKKITNLQNQINELERKQRENPNSNINQQDKQELEKLKRELEELKNKPKGKPQKENKEPDKKGDFPTGLVVGGGVVIAILLIAVIFFWKRSRKK